MCVCLLPVRLHTSVDLPNTIRHSHQLNYFICYTFISFHRVVVSVVVFSASDSASVLNFCNEILWMGICSFWINLILPHFNCGKCVRVYALWEVYDLCIVCLLAYYWIFSEQRIVGYDNLSMGWADIFLKFDINVSKYLRQNFQFRKSSD